MLSISLQTELALSTKHSLVLLGKAQDLTRDEPNQCANYTREQYLVQNDVVEPRSSATWHPVSAFPV